MQSGNNAPLLVDELEAIKIGLLQKCRLTGENQTWNVAGLI